MNTLESITYALNLVGTQWKPGGRDLRDGFDCYGLVHHVYDVCLGIQLPSHPVHYKDFERIQECIQGETGHEGNWQEVPSPATWDVTGMSSSKRFVHHVGIWIDGAILHAVPDTGVVCQSLTSLRANGIHPRHYWTLCQGG